MIHYDPEYVLVISRMIIFTRWIIVKCWNYHIEKNAHATIAVIEVPWEEANRFGIMNTNEDDKSHRI